VEYHCPIPARFTENYWVLKCISERINNYKAKYFSEIMINLEKVVLPKMSSKLKKEVKEDISKFNLDLALTPNSKNNILVTKPHDNKVFVLNCGYITSFEFPENSKNNKIESNGPYGNHRNIKMTFDYNNKQYELYGYV
jgi:hypothetical protein